MEINEQNAGPLLELVGFVLLVIAVVLFLTGLPVWFGVGFAGGMIELLGWLIMLHT